MKQRVSQFPITLMRISPTADSRLVTFKNFLETKMCECTGIQFELCKWCELREINEDKELSDDENSCED